MFINGVSQTGANINNAGVKEKYDKLIEEGLCIQKCCGQPDDVGKVVGALAIGSFSYSTGKVFKVDGGITIPRLWIQWSYVC